MKINIDPAVLIDAMDEEDIGALLLAVEKRMSREMGMYTEENSLMARTLRMCAKYFDPELCFDTAFIFSHQVDLNENEKQMLRIPNFYCHVNGRVECGKIGAIKSVRARLKLGLKEAKDYVDAWDGK